MPVLDELIEELVLLPEDKLRMAGRGFSDKMIAEKKWRSCHPDNVRVLDSFLTRYGIPVMSQLQLYVPGRKQGEWTPNPQLLRGRTEEEATNILIPYMDKAGTIVKIRPHHRGFKGDPHQVYRPKTSFLKSSICLITESEFKADAAEAYGYAAIGLPGISSMSGKNWEHFKEHIEGVNTGEFIICFDNEIKDNPEFKNYKQDWRKRYDTMAYAYAMCQKILNEGFHCKVATLPAAWMVDGKIDIDGALGQKRPLHEFKAAIDAAQAPLAYKKGLSIPDEHIRFYERKVKRIFFQEIIKIKNGCFYSLPEKDHKEGRRLMNCTIKIKNVYEELGNEIPGVRRDLVLTDEYGIESRTLPIQAAAMASKGAFTAWLMGQGNYLFYGRDSDVTNIWEYVFNQDEGDVIQLINRCGYIRELGFYLFKNVMIKDGRAIFPDDEGICWDDNMGYKVNNLDEEPIPLLSTEALNFNINHFIELLSDTTDYEKPGFGKALFAWALAAMFLEAIVEKHHLFPLIFLYGNRGSGKTTIMRWLASFFGQTDVTKSLATSSPVGISRLLGYYANIPLIVDDWRDDTKSKSYNTLFLGVYNRQAGAKGVKKAFGLQQTSIRSALGILGEEMISDNGVQTRCLSFYVTPDRKRECMSEMEDLIQTSSQFYYKILTTDYKAREKKVLACIDKSIAYLQEMLPRYEKRIIINYGIILGAYSAVMDVMDPELINFVLTRVSNGAVEMLSGDKLHRFAEDFSFGVTENLLQPHHYQFDEEGKVTLWVKGICDVMNKYYNRNNQDTSKLIIQHFSQQGYFVKLTRTLFRGGKGLLPAIILDVKRMPDTIRGHFESVSP